MFDTNAVTVELTSRAYAQLLTETLEEINTETGGIFLDYIQNNRWLVVECVDPGPNSVLTPTTFEYDVAYVNHLAHKLSQLYELHLRVLGFWHRHPGSLDYFSSTDDEANAKFAALNSEGSISALVTVDPALRLTMYHIDAEGARSRVYCQVLDAAEHIRVAPYANRKRLTRRIEDLSATSVMKSAASVVKQAAQAAAKQAAAPSLVDKIKELLAAKVRRTPRPTQFEEPLMGA